MTEHIIESIREYLEFSKDLATSGQPTREQFAWLAAAGFEKVINLATADSPGAIVDESEVVRALGMAYRQIPVVWTQPTGKDLVDFFLEMRASQGMKTMVHCVLNMRVSVFMFLYRVMEIGAAREEAWQSVLEIWQPDEVWQDFIDRSLLDHGIPSSSSG